MDRPGQPVILLVDDLGQRGQRIDQCLASCVAASLQLDDLVHHAGAARPMPPRALMTVPSCFAEHAAEHLLAMPAGKGAVALHRLIMILVIWPMNTASN